MLSRLYEVPDTLLCSIGFDGRFLEVSRGWEGVLGYADGELLGKTLPELAHPDDLESVESALRQLGGESDSARFSARCLTKSGDYRELYWNAATVVGHDSVYAAAHEPDTTSDANEAYHDPLTGLPNRQLFLDRLAHTMKRARRREDFRFAILYLGIDRFKVINDSLGHKMGDLLLAGIARVLETCVRPTDTVARLGGDEFAMMLEDIQDVSSTLRVVNRVQERLTLPFTLNEHEVFSSVSIGIVVNSPDHKQPDDFIRDANIAMFRAKEQGGAGYVIFDKGMHDQAVRRMELEMALRRAIERQEFQAYYQPIVDLASGRLIGFEALVRWLHPERGLVSPVEFIPVAEETGMIVPIGQWVLREACRQTQAWNEEFHDRPPLTVSVNLSPKQLLHRNLVGEVRAILEETGFDPTLLKLEITESAVLENTADALTLLNELKAMQIKLCLDDFGTGYSSLSYLHQLPIDILKIDRTFVNKLDENSRNGTFVETIINLSHSLNLQVISEGVETQEQAEAIRRMGSEYGQGYLYSRPVAGNEAHMLVAADSHGAG